MRLSLTFHLLDLLGTFNYPSPLKEKLFSWGERGVRPIASRRQLCSILLTNQMQNLKQSRLDQPQFPAFRLIGRFALSSHWLFRVFSFLLIGCMAVVITLVSILGHSIEKCSGSSRRFVYFRVLSNVRQELSLEWSMKDI